MIVVTSGKKFLDIDALAGCIAYAELLQLQGIDALAVSTATFNDSISPTANAMSQSLLRDYNPTPNDRFILIDVSEPDFLDKTVRIKDVIEVIDHHLGYENFWLEQGIKTNIELIGAACTQVYERWEKAGLLDRMTEESAQLLSLGILDNTLNFEADVTTDRDRQAYDRLIHIGNVDEDWAEKYFRECEYSILENTSLALDNDTKTMIFPGYDQPIKIGQLVLWNGESIIGKVSSLLEVNNHVINLVSLDNKKSYILSHDPSIQDFLTSTLRVSFVDEVAEADRLWLRKEIMKAAIDGTDKSK